MRITITDAQYRVQDVAGPPAADGTPESFRVLELIDPQTGIAVIVPMPAQGADQMGRALQGKQVVTASGEGADALRRDPS